MEVMKKPSTAVASRSSSGKRGAGGEGVIPNIALRKDILPRGPGNNAALQKITEGLGTSHDFPTSLPFDVFSHTIHNLLFR